MLTFADTQDSLAIYGPGTHPEETFVPNVQEVVQSLYWIAKEIPGELSSHMTDLASLEADVSLRTSAYLHMMLYQVGYVALPLTAAGRHSWAFLLTNVSQGDPLDDPAGDAPRVETHIRRGKRRRRRRTEPARFAAWTTGPDVLGGGAPAAGGPDVSEEEEHPE